MAVHGPNMGVILTTYKSWDDSPSRVIFVGSEKDFMVFGLDLFFR